MKIFLRGLKIYMSFPKPILLSRTLSVVVSSAVPFINIWFSARILNELAGNQNREQLIFLIALTLGLNLAAGLIRQGLSRWSSYCNASTWRMIYTVFSDKMMKMDFADSENADVQQQCSEILQHHNGMGFGLQRILVSYDSIINGLIRVALSIAFAFTLFTYMTPEGSPLAFLDSWWAVAVVILLLLGSTLLSPYLNMVGGKIWAQASEDNNRGNRIFGFYFFKLLHGTDRAKDIRIYNQYHLIQRAGTDAMGGLDKAIGYSRYHGKFASAATAVSQLSNMLIYLFVALKAYAGAFGVGNIIQYVGAITQFGNGFALILNGFGGMHYNKVYLEKCFKLLDIPSKMQSGSLGVPKKPEIEFKNVSFKYPGSENLVLKNLSMEITPGKRLAVVGMNGSGKTTMIKLLCRLYEPTEGDILLNGKNVREYDYQKYMDLLSVVFQDFALLPFTLGENVATSTNYDTKKVTEALEKSGFAERMETMGLDSYLYKNFEDEGIEISGGEAQKIALARALHKNSPVFILDEPTAALDPIAEYEIYSRFNEIIEDKTAIYISHRLASCRFCDDIVVFHEGEMIQRGQHESLLADTGGKYAELWNAQAQYYAA